MNNVPLPENDIPRAWPEVVGVLEAMGTARNIRWFSDQPVEQDLVNTLLWAATRAPSPGNSQGWDFLVVQDPELRRHIRDTLRPLEERVRAASPDPAVPGMHSGSVNLLANLHEVPVIIFVCGRPVYPPAQPRLDMMFSALFGACQNLLLAARALGLGGAMTTYHSAFEAEIRNLLGIPDDVHVAAMIPIGWPEQDFGPVRRKPLSEVVHHDRWQSGQ